MSAAYRFGSLDYKMSYTQDNDVPYKTYDNPFIDPRYKQCNYQDGPDMAIFAILPQ